MRYDESTGVERRFAAGPDDAGVRLDHFLTRVLPEASRTFGQRLVDDGLVSVNGRAAKPSLRLKPGDRVDAFVPEPVAFSAEAEPIPLALLHEDADIVVVDKPPRLVVHPSPGHERGTLVNALAYHCRDLSGVGGVLRPGIVHRLDRDTSGCLVAAKHDRAHRSLMDQFQRRTVAKTYLALVAGAPRPTAGQVAARIGRDPRDPQKMAVVARGGRDALTAYRLRETFGGASLVECDLHTGRTHQIRVHLRHVGAPILCDADYGDGRPFTRADARGAVDALLRLRADAARLADRIARAPGLGQREHDRLARRLAETRDALAADRAPASAPSAAREGPDAAPSAPPRDDAGEALLARQGLHAWRLAFDHPSTGRRLSFEAPLPPDMAAVLDALRALRDGL